MIKVKKRKILLLPGDGIGSEVIREARKIIQWFNANKSLDFEIDEDLAGGAAYDKHGTPITDEVFYKALESEVVMLGAVGGPKWDNLEFAKKPEYKKVLQKLVDYSKKTLAKKIIIHCRDEDKSSFKDKDIEIGSAIQTLGGFIAENKEGTKEIDLTFEELLRNNEDEIKNTILEKIL